MPNPLLERLRYHVTGAIERGEGKAIEEIPERCSYPRCKCIVSTSTSQPEPECPKGLQQ
jgi:hypothetical protein